MTIFAIFSRFWFQIKLFQIMNLSALLQTKIYGFDRFHGNGPYCKIPTEKEPIRALGFAPDRLCHIIMCDIFFKKSFVTEIKKF